MKVTNVDNSGNDIHLIEDVVSASDTVGWYYGFMLWGKWNKSQIFYNQNPPITAMDTNIGYATYTTPDMQQKVDSKMVTGTKEKLCWFINVSKIENCYHYQTSTNQNKVEGLTADNIKITEDISAEPFKIGNYEVTQQMIDDDVFPSLLSNGGYYGGRTLPSIVAGRKLGTILGKKLQVRSESRTLKNSRLDSGRIDKRLIAELGFGNSKVFSTTFIEQYNDAILLISVDASGSMGGDKWTNTMTAVVAICKAASMISGLDVVVSFRTTHQSGRSYNGQPMVAIGYDSRVDKFRKIENIWPSLHPGGTTPEGLCYEAIMKDFVGGTNNRDSYFLNFSDGQPMFSGEGFEYYGDSALQHTRKQVKEIVKKGISVMSYFVGDSEYDRTRNMDDFKTMYGNDAQFIDVTKVSSLAKTMNNLFLEKGK